MASEVSVALIVGYHEYNVWPAHRALYHGCANQSLTNRHTYSTILSPMSIEIHPDQRWLVRDSPIFINRFADPRRIDHEAGNTTFEDHFHRFHEIVVVHAGHATHVINGEETDTFPGEVFLIKPGMRHHFSRAEGLCLTNVMFISWRLSDMLDELREIPGFAALFLVDGRDRQEGIDRLGSRRLPDRPAATVPRDLPRLVLNAYEQTTVREICDRLIAEDKAREPGYKTALRGMLIELLVMLSRARLSSGRPCSTSSERLAVLVSALEERFFEEWSLARMADIVRCSVPSLSRNFRAQLGTSPNEYLIALRTSRAKELLLHTSLSVTQIADQTGFSDGNYLTRQFRARLGLTPRQYRRGQTR